MSKVKLNDSLTKVCCVLYDSDKVDTLVEWCKNTHINITILSINQKRKRQKSIFTFVLRAIANIGLI